MYTMVPCTWLSSFTDLHNDTVTLQYDKLTNIPCTCRSSFTDLHHDTMYIIRNIPCTRLFKSLADTVMPSGITRNIPYTWLYCSFTDLHHDTMYIIRNIPCTWLYCSFTDSHMHTSQSPLALI